MEKRSYTATGKTVEEALENAKKELGIDTVDDNFGFEVVEYDKKGFLGIGSKPAKVRVYEIAEDEPVTEAPKNEKKPRRDGDGRRNGRRHDRRRGKGHHRDKAKEPSKSSSEQ